MTKNLGFNIIILSISILISSALFAQKEANIWHFGQFAGVDYNTVEAQALVDGNMTTQEGCASICDNMGNLLFYTNGMRVWNQMHEQMPNGVDLFGNASASQSSIIVKKPGLNNLYYIFTVDQQAGVNGFRYSEVDMDLENGLGDVTENKNILIINSTLEKVTVIRMDNLIDYWIITHLYNSTSFHAYALTESGLDMEPVISSVGTLIAGGGITTWGYMKANQIGDRIAIANGGGLSDVELFDFDKLSGSLSNPIIFDNFENEMPYGIEFSPDGSLLYVSILGPSGIVYQYNLEAGSPEAIINSKTEIGSGFNYGGALQLAPDGKIYHVGDLDDWLASISSPNSLGVMCNYQLEGLYLEGKTGGWGLPNFVNSIYQDPPISTSNVCDGDSTFFTINFPNVDSVFWDFGEPISGADNFSSKLDPAHFYSEVGSYIVTLFYYSNNESHSYSFNLKIYPYPDIYFGEDSLLCQDEFRTLDATTFQGYYQWQDNSTRPDYIATEPGSYWVEVLANSCLGGDTIVFDVCDPNLIMPSVFTPNGDGLNDRFKPIIYSDVYEISINIFDRWGKLVYENSSLEPGWDGKSKGKNCSEGIYFWTINYYGYLQIETRLNGSITLLR